MSKRTKTLHCQPGDVCMVVGGQVGNVGATCTLTEYCHAAGGWLFDCASWPLLDTDGDEWAHSFDSAAGACAVIGDDELLPLDEFQATGEKVHAVLGRHALYPVEVAP